MSERITNKITIPVFDITSLKKVNVIVIPLSNNLYKVILENQEWKSSFSQLGELGNLIKDPGKLKEYKERMGYKRCGFYPYCNSPSKSDDWVCMQNKSSRLKSCIAFRLFIIRKKQEQ